MVNITLNVNIKNMVVPIRGIQIILIIPVIMDSIKCIV